MALGCFALNITNEMMKFASKSLYTVLYMYSIWKDIKISTRITLRKLEQFKNLSMIMCEYISFRSVQNVVTASPVSAKRLYDHMSKVQKMLTYVSGSNARVFFGGEGRGLRLCMIFIFKKSEIDFLKYLTQHKVGPSPRVCPRKMIF